VHGAEHDVRLLAERARAPDLRQRLLLPLRLIALSETAAAVRRALAERARPAYATALRWFFKTGPGEYGEGDVFIGVRVPAQRAVARQFRRLPPGEVRKLLASKVHEHRLTALLILVHQYQRGDERVRGQIVKTYRANARRVNNWDLVDSSAPYILGDWLRRGDRGRARRELLRLAKARSIWQRRTAMLAAGAFIRAGEAEPALEVAGVLLDDEHDLIHKAVGWMLREVGQRVGRELLRGFLRAHAGRMPRTMLRYAIEHLAPAERKRWLAARPATRARRGRSSRG
jgi:3-methyladenine DNA glycosylase AlkD